MQNQFHYSKTQTEAKISKGFGQFVCLHTESEPGSREVCESAIIGPETIVIS